MWGQIRVAVSESLKASLTHIQVLAVPFFYFIRNVKGVLLIILLNYCKINYIFNSRNVVQYFYSSIINIIYQDLSGSSVFAQGKLQLRYYQHYWNLKLLQGTFILCYSGSPWGQTWMRTTTLDSKYLELELVSERKWNKDFLIFFIKHSYLFNFSD